MKMNFNFLFFYNRLINRLMSCCSGTFDNKNCPLKMADGRYFTNYEPRCMRNAYLTTLLAQNNIPNSSYEQRLFLQHNYNVIVEAERKKALDALLPCVPCGSGELINEKNPQMDNKYKIYCDNVSCKANLTNEAGLGTTQNF